MSDIKKIEDQQEEMRLAGADAPAPAPSTQHAAATVETVKSIKDLAATFPLENAEQPADTSGLKRRGVGDPPTLKNSCHRPLGNLWQSWQCPYG